MNEKVLIVGAGTGLSASIARLFSSEGMAVSYTHLTLPTTPYV